MAYQPIAVPNSTELHFMNRLAGGYSRALTAQLRAAGGPDAWFEAQLRFRPADEDAATSRLRAYFPDLADSPRTRWSRFRKGTKQRWRYGSDLSNLTVLRRVHSHGQLHEVMTDFWNQHLYIPVDPGKAFVHRTSYDATIRRHALGRFDQLLSAATLHPAMLIYLDNWQSVKGRPNENHGRELLELHTVGSGYTERMVKDSAKILSGYTVDFMKSWRPLYDRGRHTTGRVRVLGFQHRNSRADGRAVTRAYLTYLARHPLTAQTIARKLATRFVSDEPSAALVEHLATVFLQSGTDVKATLRALVASAEFRESAGSKVRNPTEDLVATLRVLGADVQRPANANAFAHDLWFLGDSAQLHQWPRPDGPPDRNSAWSSPTRILNSFFMHFVLAGGGVERSGLDLGEIRDIFPAGGAVRMDELADHLARTLLGRSPTEVEIDAVVDSLGSTRATMIQASNVDNWIKATRLRIALLDSPAHMTR